MRDLADLELIQRLRQGEDRALNVLMDRYQDRLYAFVLRFAGDRAVADEIVQETFTKVYFRASQFDGRHAFGTWLFRIALNLCRDRHRARKRPPEPLDSALELPATDISPEASVSEKQEVARLKAAIDRLPPELKATFILYALEERSQAECAKILGISTKAVETRVYRARKQLINLLKVPEI